MNLLKTVRNDYPVILFLGLVSIYHVILQDRGAFAWPDEQLYSDALKSIACLFNLDITGFCRELTGFGARPAEATLRLIPATIQIILEKWQGISPYNNESLRIPATFNIISSFFLSFVFYRLSQTFFENNRLLSILSTIVYALLVSNNVFVRHIIPYDTALLFCLLSLYYALKNKEPEESWCPQSFKVLIISGTVCAMGLFLYPVSFLVSRNGALIGSVFCFICILCSLWLIGKNSDKSQTKYWIKTGLISGFGLALYPAFYSFPGGVLLIILLTKNKSPYIGLSWERFYAAVIFGLSILSVMFFYEVVARIGDVSYLASAYRLSKTITQGEFSEGYVFLPKFFVEVEGAIGILLLLAVLFWIVLIFTRLIKKETVSRPQILLLLCFVIWFLIYLVYATQSTVLHKLAFTGRYARMYFPFVVWAAIAVQLFVSRLILKRIVFSVFFITSLISFFSYAIDYRNLAYPVNVLNENGIKWEDVVDKNKVYETERIPQEWIVTIPGRGIFSEPRYITQKDDERFILMNFSFFNIVMEKPAYKPAYVPPEGAEVIFQGTHFLTFRSSTYEGSNILQRKELTERKFKLAIYKIR